MTWAGTSLAAAATRAAAVLERIADRAPFAVSELP